MKKLTLLATLVVGLAACGSQNLAYQPLAWGPPGYCYYLYSPWECWGHHPGMPMYMPLWWHQRYAGYYDSPAYIQGYVPGRYRSTATSRSRTFEKTYSTAIRSSSRYAAYKGSNGQRYSGTKVGRSATFSGGSVRSSGFSSGALRSNPCAAVHLHRYFTASTIIAFSGGARSSFSGGSSYSSGSSRSSYSGGSLRSSGSSVRSRPSGSRNC